MSSTPYPSVVSVPQKTLAVKFTVLPAGVTLAADGLTLCKRCPACGGTIRVENTPKAVAWIAARNRTCRACDEEMAASLTAWRCAQ